MFSHTFVAKITHSPGIHAKQRQLANSQRNRSWMTVVGYFANFFGSSVSEYTHKVSLFNETSLNYGNFHDSFISFVA